MPYAANDVTREEFDSMKASLERLEIAVAVLQRDTQFLMTAVADLSEMVNERLDKMDGRLDKMDGRFDKMDGRLDKLERTMADGFAALTSAILTLTPR